jgi:hypothetical protein
MTNHMNIAVSYSRIELRPSSITSFMNQMDLECEALGDNTSL